MNVEILRVPVDGALEVVSVTTGKDGMIYGGNTGHKGHLLFGYEPSTGQTEDLGSLVVSAAEIIRKNGKALQQKIHHALRTAPDGTIVGGTGQNVSVMSDEFCTSADDGGHVFHYFPETGECKDLGIPVEGEWIINLCLSPDGGTAYGMTYPLNHVFAVDLETGDKRIVGQVRGIAAGDGSCCHETAVDFHGNLIGSCRGGYIFKFNPERGEIEESDAKIPGNARRIDSLMRHPNGLLYGGTWESGNFFSLDTSTMTITDYGSIVEGARLPALAVDPDGVVYGAAGGGAQYNSSNATLFRHDPKTAKTEIIDEIVAVNGVIAQRVHCLTVGQDGRLYAGETGATGIEAGDVGMNPYLYMIEL